MSLGSRQHPDGMTAYGSLALALACAAAATVAARDRPLERVLRSPDGKLRAVVHTEGEGHTEGVVEIWRGTAHRFRWSGASTDEEHGWAMEKAAWTADGKFFVFSVSSSGGHQPWHHPTYAYRTRTNTLLSLEKAVGPITDAEFRLEKGSVVRTRVLKGKDVAGKPALVQLLQIR